jgi:PTH1 family peptidyl-tRNA hydrolase
LSNVQLIAGLGNPGSQYEKTRHNLGFLLVDAFAEQLAAISRQTLSWRERSGALVAEARFNDERLLLVKPQTFMNRSGEPLIQVMQFFKVEVAGVVVAHDEVDIPLGALRIKQGGGDGGHNGIKSVVSTLGSADFVRVRLGVGRPPIPAGVPTEAGIASWVLGRISAEEQPAIKELLTRGSLALEALCTETLKTDLIHR